MKPLRDGRHDPVRKYRDILVGSRSFALYPVDRAVAERGAEIRAAYQVRVPDAIQLATASLQGADAFVTNDARLKRFGGMEILLLDDFVGAGPPQR